MKGGVLGAWDLLVRILLLTLGIIFLVQCSGGCCFYWVYTTIFRFDILFVLSSSCTSYCIS